jgi:hypothetical protein
MDREDGWIRHRFAPGEEPTVYTEDATRRRNTNCDSPDQLDLTNGEG